MIFEATFVIIMVWVDGRDFAHKSWCCSSSNSSSSSRRRRRKRRRSSSSSRVSWTDTLFWDQEPNEDTDEHVEDDQEHKGATKDLFRGFLGVNGIGLCARRVVAPLCFVKPSVYCSRC